MVEHKRYIIAFEGIDGAGKSTLSKLLVARSQIDNNQLFLAMPYSSEVGFAADHLRKSRKIIEWSNYIGKLHNRAPEGVNCVYDRNILTWIAQAIRNDIPKKQILESLKEWDPLPDVIFLCEVEPERALARIKRIDEFANVPSLREYQKLSESAADFIEKELKIKVVRIDTSKSIEESLMEIKKYIDTNLKVSKKRSKSF